MRRRLRKKLRIEEYSEFAFGVIFCLTPSITKRQHDAFIDDFLENAIEANELLFLGSGTKERWYGGAYSNNHREHPTSLSHRETVYRWLTRHPQVATAEVSNLFDLWYEELPSIFNTQQQKEEECRA